MIRIRWAARFLGIAALCAALSGAGALAPALGALDPVRALLIEINDARSDAGLDSLRFDPRLARAAQAQSRMLARRGRLSHSAGGPLAQRAARAGFRYWMIAENLAAGIADPAGVVTSWLHSPRHRANLLRPDARVAGVGYVARGQRYSHYWTLILADPVR